MVSWYSIIALGDTFLSQWRLIHHQVHLSSKAEILKSETKIEGSVRSLRLAAFYDDPGPSKLSCQIFWNKLEREAVFSYLTWTKQYLSDVESKRYASPFLRQKICMTTYSDKLCVSQRILINFIQNIKNGVNIKRIRNETKNKMQNAMKLKTYQI